MRQQDPNLPIPNVTDRPGDRWRCGRAAVCDECPNGPLPNGRCSLSSTPCRPTRTWFSRRRQINAIIIAFGIGGLLIALGGNWRREIFAPGPLSRSHGQILSGKLKNERCAACHPAAANGWSEWFGSGSPGHQNITQDDLCIRCHHQTIPADRAQLPHNLTSDELVSLQRYLEQPATDQLSLSVVNISHNQSIQCAACHREHHGELNDLNALSSQQCQVCHQQQFASFAEGHPDWGLWPYGQGGNIAFNHVSHLEHFAQKTTTFDCQHCHTTTGDTPTAGSVTANLDVKRALPYEQACAQCHEDALRVTSLSGISIFELPTLDTESLAKHNLELRWPEHATGVEPLVIAPITRWLISRDPKVQAAIEQLIQVDPSNWQAEVTAEQAAATVTVGQAIIELLTDLATQPQASLPSDTDPDLAKSLFHYLSPQLAADVLDQWFNDSSIDTTPSDTTIGWIRDDRQRKLRYRGRGHADPVLKAVAELANSNLLSDDDQRRLRDLPAVAACLQCHPNARAGDATSWLGQKLPQSDPSFTKFSHRPHLNIQVLADCQHCHVVFPQPNQQLTGAAIDFAPLSRATCVNCHRPGAAGDNCTQCHRYHVPLFKNLSEKH